MLILYTYVYTYTFPLIFMPNGFYLACSLLQMRLKSESFSYYVYTSLSAFPFFFGYKKKMANFQYINMAADKASPVSPERAVGRVWGRGSNSYMCDISHDILRVVFSKSFLRISLASKLNKTT